MRFLDWKVSEINRLIRLRRKKLSILHELVDSLFHKMSSHAVRMVKLKYLVKLNDKFIDIDSNEYYIKTGMYNRGRGIFRREPIRGEDMGDSSFQRIHAGCVMISGQFAWEAATYITTPSDEVCVASHRYYLLLPVDGMTPEYLWCFLMSDYGQMQMKLCSHDAAGRNRPLNIKELLNVYVPVVDCKEKVSLISAVNTFMHMQKNVLEFEKSLTELKTRLISDTVTGKIDVRNIEIPEYELVGDEAQAVEEMATEESDNGE